MRDLNIYQSRPSAHAEQLLREMEVAGTVSKIVNLFPESFDTGRDMLPALGEVLVIPPNEVLNAIKRAKEMELIGDYVSAASKEDPYGKPPQILRIYPVKIN